MKRVIGLPGDTIEVRDGSRDPQRRGRCPRQRIADYRDAGQPQQPVPGEPAPRCAMAEAKTARPLCLYPALSARRLPGGRSYEVLDQIDDGAADNFGADHACPTAICS